jgi:hypothetical protein
MIKFLLLVNKQGQTRLARYFGDELRSQDERRALEAEAVRRCLARGDRQASFFEHRSHRIVYRRYASLFFLAGVDEDEVSERGKGGFSVQRGKTRRRPPLPALQRAPAFFSLNQSINQSIRPCFRRSDAPPNPHEHPHSRAAQSTNKNTPTIAKTTPKTNNDRTSSPCSSSCTL